jgi:hypothetical protein
MFKVFACVVCPSILPIKSIQPRLTLTLRARRTKVTSHCLIHHYPSWVDSCLGLLTDTVVRIQVASRLELLFIGNLFEDIILACVSFQLLHE